MRFQDNYGETLSVAVEQCPPLLMLSAVDEDTYTHHFSTLMHSLIYLHCLC